MFGSYTNKLAILGVCAIVFWVICWLILVSKNKNLSKWIQGIATVSAGLFAFCTAPFSAIFSIPIVMNFQRSSDEIRRQEYHRGLSERFSESSKQLQQAHDAGYKEATDKDAKLFRDQQKKIDDLKHLYTALYFTCRVNPNMPEMIKNYPTPSSLYSPLNHPKKAEFEEE